MDFHSSVFIEAGFLLCRIASTYLLMINMSCTISFHKAKFCHWTSGFQLLYRMLKPCSFLRNEIFYWTCFFFLIFLLFCCRWIASRSDTTCWIWCSRSMWEPVGYVHNKQHKEYDRRKGWKRRHSSSSNRISRYFVALTLSKTQNIMCLTLLHCQVRSYILSPNYLDVFTLRYKVEGVDLLCQHHQPIHYSICGLLPCWVFRSR